MSRKFSTMRGAEVRSVTQPQRTYRRSGSCASGKSYTSLAGRPRVVQTRPNRSTAGSSRSSLPSGDSALTRARSP